MIHPDKIGAEAKKKEDENLKFRSYLKGHADEEELDIIRSTNLVTFYRKMVAVSLEIVSRIVVKNIPILTSLSGCGAYWEC